MDGFAAYKKHVNPILAELETLSEIDPQFVSAEKCVIRDIKGKEYYDFLSGHGSFNLGHNHPAILESLIQESQKGILNIYGIGSSMYMGELAEKLCLAAGDPFEIAFFSNSGTEAVEGALKIARAATGRSKILYCQAAYHGTTLGSLSMMGKGPWRKPFGPLLENFIEIPFNDLDALQDNLKKQDVAAFVLEPIQTEAGIIMPSENYLQEVIRLCRSVGTLSVFDEIQTGLGRTGELFAFNHSKSAPDIITIAKSLGGGVLPIGAYVTTRKIYDQAYGTFEYCASHHSTFGGNSLCCRVALKALDLLTQKELHVETKKKSLYFINALKKDFLGNKLIKNIRGKGFLIGIEFNKNQHPWLSFENIGLDSFAEKNSIPTIVMKRLIQQGVITTICGHNWDVLKIEPPLTIEKEDLDIFIDLFAKSLHWIKGLT